MSDVILSNGAVAAMYNGSQPEQPVVQVIDIKRLQAKQADGGQPQERYRLIISDGVHYQQAMLATQQNHLIHEDALALHAVIQLEEYICNTVQDRKIVIILNLSVTAPPQNGNIGSPINIESAGAAPDMTPAETPAPNPVKTEAAQAPASVYGGPGIQAPPAQTYGGPVHNSMSYVNKSEFPEAVFPIRSLNPYQNRWTIKVRVTSKGDIRRWDKPNSSGKLFGVDFIDADKSEIRATCFNDAVDMFYDILEPGKCYLVSRAEVKMANRNFTSINNEYELRLNRESMVRLVDNDPAIPGVLFDFSPINHVESVPPDTLVDVIGIATKADGVSTIQSKNTGKEFSKRSVTLLDQSNIAIDLTLWGSTAETFSAEGFPVVAIKGAKVSDYGGRSLSTVSSSNIQINPDIPEAANLRAWYDSVGNTANARSLTGAPGGGGGRTDTFRTLEQIREDGLGEESADYSSVRAVLSFIKNDANISYPACPSDGCNKKLDGGPDKWHCIKCDKNWDNADHRYILSCSATDWTGSSYVSMFNDTGVKVMGATAGQVLELRNQNNDIEWDRVFRDAKLRPYIFKIRSKKEVYNDEARLKHTILTAEPVNFVQDTANLIAAIKQYNATPPTVTM